MQSTQHLWHPISGAKLYESSGSRTTFGKKWSESSEHVVEPSDVAAAERQKKTVEANLKSRRTAQNLMIARLEIKACSNPRR
jgi:hypothetical protein